MSAEDLLRTTLRVRAEEAASRLTLDDVRRGAAARRRRSVRRTTAVAAAAALVALGLPAALLWRPVGHAPSPAPSPTTNLPSSTAPTTAPTTRAPSGGAALRLIPQGRPPGIAYLHAGTIHRPDGSTTTLPDPGAGITDFTGYHGGWLVGVGQGADRVRWYDNTGQRRSDGPGIGRFAVSEDGTRTAYSQSGALHIGITSGMGNGEQTVPGDAQQLQPIGFLRNGDLVYQAGETEVAVTDGSTIPGMVRAHAVSAVDDLVAGEDASGNTVVVSGRGQQAWTSSTWSVWSFSPDGRYAAATHTTSQAESNAFAVLDARTGAVVAENPGLPNGDSIGGIPVFDEDGSLLVAASSGSLQQTVLRLDPDGTLTRATPLFAIATSSDMDYVDFVTRP